MEFVSDYKPKKSCLKIRQSDNRPWHGDEDVEAGDPEADLFEQEMNAELETRAQQAELESGFGMRSTQLAIAGPSGSSSAGASGVDDKFYDKIYFDSDDDDEEENHDEALKSAKRQQVGSKRELLTNDDLMYDPDMDDQDQAWVDNIRQQYQTKSKLQSSHKARDRPEPASSSDAVLNCPACFAVLCLDCQRHDSYKHQYRAMFVINCTVDHGERLTFPTTNEKKKQKNKKKQKTENSDETDEELYNPVKCTKCSTQVAVFDKDEIYHFFNVVASHT